MKIRWKYCLAALLGVLGFSSCGKIMDVIEDGGGGSFLAMYGQPHANYKVIGEVKDPTGKPIEGIRVVVSPGSDHPSWYNDTLYTDSKGQFQKEQIRFSWPDEFKDGTVKFEDIDGAEKGSFKTKELKRSELEVKQTAKGKGAWYQGDFTITAKTKLEKAD